LRGRILANSEQEMSDLKLAFKGVRQLRGKHVYNPRTVALSIFLTAKLRDCR
jgi:hypothetical protein